MSTRLIHKSLHKDLCVILYYQNFLWCVEGNLNLDLMESFFFPGMSQGSEGAQKLFHFGFIIAFQITNNKKKNESVLW